MHGIIVIYVFDLRNFSMCQAVASSIADHDIELVITCHKICIRDIGKIQSDDTISVDNVTFLLMAQIRTSYFYGERNSFDNNELIIQKTISSILLNFISITFTQH